MIATDISSADISCRTSPDVSVAFAESNLQSSYEDNTMESSKHNNTATTEIEASTSKGVFRYTHLYHSKILVRPVCNAERDHEFQELHMRGIRSAEHAI